MTGDIVAGLSLTATVIAAAIAYLQLRRTPRGTVNHLPRLDAAFEPLPVKHNLPPRRGFIGRSDDWDQLVAGLGKPYAPVVITGLGGVGKTALAAEAAWRVVDGGLACHGIRFDAVVWADVRSGGCTLGGVLETITRVLGFPYLRSAPLEGKLERTLRYLQKIRTLLVLDNFEYGVDAEVGDFLARVPRDRTKVLITIRERPQDDEEWLVPLGALTQADAVALAAEEVARLRLDKVHARPAELAEDVSAAAGGNPLAIRLVIGQIKDGIAPEAALGSLSTPSERVVFPSVYDKLWSSVLADEDLARDVLMAVALHPGPASRSAIRYAVDSDPELALRRLLRLSLLDVVECEQHEMLFDLHTLTRVFVAGKLDGDRVRRAELLDRLVEHYLVHACRYTDIHQDPENVRRLDAESGNILAFAAHADVIARASRRGPDWRRVIRFAEAMAAFLWGRGRWVERNRLCSRAVVAAREIDDPLAQARQHAMLGRVYCWLGDQRSAKAELEHADTVLGDKVAAADLAIADRLRGQIARYEGRFGDAEPLFEAVLEVATLCAEDEGRVSGRAATLVELGLVARGKGDLKAAHARFSDALRLDEQLNTLEGMAVSLSYLGTVALELGKTADAEKWLQRGLSLAQRVGRLSAVGRCQVGLARIYVERGRADLAHRLATDAEDALLMLGARDSLTEVREVVARCRRLLPSTGTGHTDSLLDGYDAVIFDCDDTLVATARMRWSVLIETAATFGIALDEETIRASWGKPFDKLIAAILPDLDPAKFLPAYQFAMRMHKPELTRGARLVLAELFRRGIPMEIVTSSSRELIMQDLEELEVGDYFDAVHGYEQTQYHKPDPRVLRSMLERPVLRDMPREKVLFIGDSLRDLLVAQGNRIDFAAVLTGLEAEADFVAEGLPKDRIFGTLEDVLLG